ncbi:MAG: sensor histidine kinase [Alphaproteobacteria bacterium]
MTERNSLTAGAEPYSDDPVAAAVRRQQQLVLMRQAPLMYFVNLVVAVFVTGFLSVFVAAWQLIVWLAPMIAISVYHIAVAMRLRRKPIPDRVSGRTLRRAEYWAAVTGLLWAILFILFPLQEPTRYEMFLIVVMVGLVAGCVNMLQPLPRLSGWFAATVLVGAMVRLGMEPDPLHITVAILILIFFATLISSSRRAYRQLVATVEASMELERAKVNLVDAIESIRDAFAIWRPDGTLELANERFKSWFGGREKLEDVPGTGGLQKMPGGVWLQGYVRPMSGGGHVSVHTDVTALKNRERELIAAKLQAEEANNAKSHFLANMSHELRTPLNAIMGFAEMMRKGVFGPLGTDKYRQYADDIHGSAAHLLAVINDILNFSKVQSAGYELNFERVDIARIVDWVLDSCDHMKDGFDARRIDVRIEPDFGPLRVDSGVLRQVLLNLVRNAMKFTPPSGRVTIHARIDERERPRIAVLDTGIGIPKEMVATVRQPFQQAEHAFQRRFRGAGLGLSISDALIRLLGGELELESELGKGTRVEIVLPANLRVRDYSPAQAS